MPENRNSGSPEGALAEARPDLAVERTDLAMERTVLAVERTLLAYVRTALAGLAVGGSSMTFLEGEAAFYGGAAFVAFSSLLLAFGVARALVVMRRMRRIRRAAGDNSDE